MQTLEKSISGLAFGRSETIAEGLVHFIREVSETSGVGLGDAETALLDEVREVAEVIVRSGAFAGLRLDLQVATVTLAADYWTVDGKDDKDIHLLRFLSKVPDRIGLTVLVGADQSLLTWLGVDKLAEHSTPRLSIFFEQRHPSPASDAGKE